MNSSGGASANNTSKNKNKLRYKLSKYPSLKSPLFISLYFILALAAYWPVLPLSSTRVVEGGVGDPALTMWFLKWVPYALSHGHNPLFTDWINVPHGANLAQNTLMPLLCLIFAPITYLLDPYQVLI